MKILSCENKTHGNDAEFFDYNGAIVWNGF